MQLAIETKDLTRRFGTLVAVDGLDLSVPQGCIYGFLGLNGAGKTTTIRILATLLAPTGGEARVMGRDVAREALAVRRLVGLVGDEGGESRPAWTAREYLGYFARVRGLPAPDDEVERALGAVGLERRAWSRAIRTYSAGMRRRVEVARALLGDPRILFLDEPTRGLDLPARHATWKLLRDLVDQEGVTVFLSSHDPAEIQTLCEELTVIARGREAYRGSVRDLGRDARAFEATLIDLLQGQRVVEAKQDGVA